MMTKFGLRMGAVSKRKIPLFPLNLTPRCHPFSGG